MLKLVRGLVLVSMVHLAIASSAHSDSVESVEQRLRALEQALDQQKRIIAEQQQLISQQRKDLDALTPTQLDQIRGAALPPTQLPSVPGYTAAPRTVAADEHTGPSPAPVGEAPEQERPQVEVISDVGGVLTRTGDFVFEPSIEYSHSSVNRLTFRGIELQDTVLIGVIEASDADRDLFSPALTARYGVFDDFEIEAKIPYVYRDDRLTFLIPQASAPDVQREESLSGDGLGDIEVAAHYQITRSSPFLVGNVRFKTTTGDGPFDIDRDDDGLELELPTGSGFYTVEPSLTLIYPTDPAVLFASLSYQWSIPDDVNMQIGDVTVRDVDPGDTIGVSFGMGFAVNDDFSFSLGYKHSLVLGTETEIELPTGETRNEKSNSLHLGSLLFGLGYRVTDNVGVNLDVEVGATEDAPDMRAMIRVPITLDVF